LSTRVLTGDCRQVLRTLPDASVHMCVTSPPYFGLRDYGTAKWEGGDAACDHMNGALASDKSTLAGYTSENIKLRTNGMPFRDECGKCGAQRVDSQIGLEPTPDDFVAAMVAVFREVRRVLRDDGTLWLNLGDSYCNTDKWGGGGNTGKNTIALDGTVPSWAVRRKREAMPGLKPKDLIGIPWRVAFALQADGWYLRSDIIWHKPNPMPESVTDRPTSAHEHVFLFAKSAKYYYDAEAVKEAVSGGAHAQRKDGMTTAKQQANGGRRDGNSLTLSSGEFTDRNLRNVWTVATQPFPGSHFAVFPPALIEPCIKAGCPIGGTVLDPFGGAGTTGMVADRLGRSAVLIELNPTYASMIRDRITADAGMFASITAEAAE